MIFRDQENENVALDRKPSKPSNPQNQEYIMYKRSMSETLSDRNDQPMLIWEQGMAASAANAKFHVLARIYSYDALTDLVAACKDLVTQIETYRSDLLDGLIDEKGNETQKGCEKRNA